MYLRERGNEHRCGSRCLWELVSVGAGVGCVCSAVCLCVEGIAERQVTFLSVLGSQATLLVF